jgi:hypothetical protein
MYVSYIWLGAVGASLLGFHLVVVVEWCLVILRIEECKEKSKKRGARRMY